MAFTAYLFVQSEKGVIKGYTNENEKTSDGKTVKEMSRVQAFNHSIRIPTHAQTGEAQGPGQHSPLSVTIDVDCSMAELYKALTLNSRIQEVKVYFFRAGAGTRASGKTNERFNNWMTVTLNGARVVGLELRKHHSMEGQNLPDLLDVTFTYYKIKWEDHNDAKEAEYAWMDKAGDGSGGVIA